LKGKPHPHKSHPQTEESRRKKSEANRGRPKPPRTEEHARKISEALRGPNNPNYGKRFSEETRQKMRAAHAHAHNGRRRGRSRSHIHGTRINHYLQHTKST